MERTKEVKDWQKAVKKHLTGPETKVHADRITIKGDGRVEVRRTYFYTMGMNAQKWAEKVAMELTRAGFQVEVKGQNHWAAWPKQSYWSAFVTMKPYGWQYS